MKDAEGQTIEIIHSLAKWKRLALKRYSIALHEGIYTDMNAIRRDETLDNTHSIYVEPMGLGKNYRSFRPFLGILTTNSQPAL